MTPTGSLCSTNETGTYISISWRYPFSEIFSVFSGTLISASTVPDKDSCNSALPGKYFPTIDLSSEKRIRAFLSHTFILTIPGVRIESEKSENFEYTSGEVPRKKSSDERWNLVIP